MMNRGQSRSYDKEFKLNAVKRYHGSGRTCCQLGKELGVPKSTLAAWVGKYKQEGVEAIPGKGFLKASEAEISQLRKELAVVREKRDSLKKALGIFSVASQSQYRFMQAHTEEFNVRRMAKVLRVSRSGYYQFIKANLSRGCQEDKRLLCQIKQIHAESRQI